MAVVLLSFNIIGRTIRYDAIRNGMGVLFQKGRFHMRYVT